MYEWVPITRSEFEDLLSREIAEFEERDVELWSRFRVDIRTAPILRSEQFGIENVFVVAAVGERILFFDDVEEEFGVARLPDSGPIEDYGTHGELRSALQGLARCA